MLDFQTDSFLAAAKLAGLVFNMLAKIAACENSEQEANRKYCRSNGGTAVRFKLQ